MGITSLMVRIFLNLAAFKFMPLLSQGMRHQLFEVYKHIELEISQKFKHCSSFTFVLETKSTDFIEDQWSANTHSLKSPMQDGKHSLSLPYGANLVLEFDNTRHNFSLQTILYIRKYQDSCSVGVYNINNFLQLQESELEAMETFVHWQDNLLKAIPTPLSSFFIFFTTVSDSMEKLRLFAKLSSIIRFTLFIVINGDSLNVYKTTPGLENSLVQIASFENEQLKKTSDLIQSPPENFGREVLNIVVCPICTSEFESFQKTGIWGDATMAIIYEAIKDFNVTFETSSAMGIPTGETNENGEWDEFTRPLLDGSAAVSTTVKPTHLKAEVIYLSQAHMFDSAIFITGPPKKSNHGSVTVLKDPLENRVWIGFWISVCFMLLALEGIIYFRTGSCAHHTMVKIIIYPILDQVAFTHRSTSSFSSDRVVNIMMGTWYISLIVLACAYKSKLISAIVCPHFDARPQTFSELAWSKYDIGVVFLTGFLENDFKAMNNSVNAEIARRAIEYDYLAEDCYQRIFEGDRVCIGYTAAMESIGGEYLRDINGQKLYTKSKDAHFQGVMAFGVSKYYPMFLDPINFYLSVSSSVGLTQFYTGYFNQKVLQKGKGYALKMQHVKKYYAGNADFDREEEEDQRFSAVLKKLLFYAFGACLLTFLAEKTSNLLLKLFMSGHVILISNESQELFQRVQNHNVSMEKNMMFELFPSKGFLD